MTMTAFSTTRFGTIECTDEDIVTFKDGLLGFPQLRQYVLIQHKEGSPFRWMQSLEEGGVAFLVIDPTHYVSDYAPEIPDRTAEKVNLTTETPCLVYTIVTIPKGRPEDMTLNLAGPLVINGLSGEAVQVVLEDDSYPIRHKVFSETRSEAVA
ncbi:MAG: flagellar assembly protein FliW [Fimbriimonadaceae bacterium]|jgi:flagellar assembly factor FliW|nr:flagellar assembly protein FliW [Fimbriimonadaceae bacterium]